MPENNPIFAMRAADRRQRRPDLREVDAAAFGALVRSGRGLAIEGIRTPENGQLRWPADVVGGKVRRADIVSVPWQGTKGRPSMMTGVAFDDCMIDPFDVGDSMLTRCSFVNCAFGLFWVGRMNDGAVVDCAFRGCRLGEWFVHDSRIERTRFDSVRSGTLSFTRTTFLDVSFGGRPGLLEFDRCRFDGLDLSGANPKRIEIRRPIGGSRARMFDRPDHFVIPCASLRQLLPIARPRVSVSAFAAFEIFIDAFGLPAGPARAWADRPTHVDVRLNDIVRDTEATASDQATLVDLVRQVRVVEVEVD